MPAFIMMIELKMVPVVTFVIICHVGSFVTGCTSSTVETGGTVLMQPCLEKELKHLAKCFAIIFCFAMDSSGQVLLLYCIDFLIYSSLHDFTLK